MRIVILVIISLCVMSDSSKLASKFVRESLGIQFGLAERVAKALKSDVVLYCSDGCLEGAEVRLVDGIRYLEKGEVRGVLSETAQRVFKTANTYHQFLGDRDNTTVTAERVVLNDKR